MNFKFSTLFFSFIYIYYYIFNGNGPNPHEILIDNKSNIENNENNIIVSNLNFIQEKNKNNLELLNKIKELSINTITTYQNFIRDKYDKS